MANVIEYAKLYQKQLDKLALQGLRTGWMEANAGQVIYNGGKEIKIPKMALDGLADYSRANGYADGDVTLEYETRSMTQDRGRRFSIDAMDVDESGFVATAAAVLGSFQSEKVIPEVDAFRMAMLYKVAAACGHVQTYTPSATDILAKLKADIKNAKKNGAVNPVIHITFDALSLLEIALAGQLRNTTWKQGGIDTTVPAVDGCPLIAMEDARMYKELNISATSGYTGSGIINWIVVDGRAPIAVSKTDVPRIFTPDVNQDADAWRVTYRKYHDIWIPDNKRGLVWASVQSGGSGGNIDGKADGNVVPSVNLNLHEATVAEAGTVTLIADVFPVGETVTWASSASGKATVSDGVVTGVDAGEATISASITVGGVTYKDECAVTVTE